MPQSQTTVGHFQDRDPERTGAGCRPRVLVVAPAPIVSVVLTLAKPLNRLRDAGGVSVRYTYAWSARREDLSWADIVLFCRPAEVDELRLMGRARREMPVGRFYGKPLRQWIMRVFLRQADGILVHNRRLAEKVAARGGTPIMLPQHFDAGLVAGIHPAPTLGDGTVRVAYPTSRRASDTLGRLFLDAWPLLPQDVADRVELHVWGGVPAGFEGLPRLSVQPYQPDYDAFIRDLAARGYDIGLAPLAGDDFHACKTELKFREYGGCGIPGIYSAAPPYSWAVADGETGLLVENRVEAWAEAISRLAREPATRQRIAGNARRAVAERYGDAVVVQAWHGCLSDLRRRPGPEGLPSFPWRMLGPYALQLARDAVRATRQDREWIAKLPEA